MMGYMSGLWSAALVLAASHHSLTLPPTALLIALVVGWGVLVCTSVPLYFLWRPRVKSLSTAPTTAPRRTEAYLEMQAA